MEIEFEIITEGNVKKLSNGAIINRYSHICKGSHIGVNAMIGSFCYVARGAKVGDNTRVQNHVSVWDGVEIADNVFIGPSVTFTNCKHPELRQERILANKEFIPDRTIIQSDAVICAAAVIVAPCIIGEGARIGAGSVVLQDIQPNEKKNGLIKGRGKEEQPKKRRGRPKAK